MRQNDEEEPAQIVILTRAQYDGMKLRGIPIQAGGHKLLLCTSGAVMWRGDVESQQLTPMNKSDVEYLPKKRRRKANTLNSVRDPYGKKERVFKYLQKHGDTRLTVMARGVQMAATTLHSVLSKGSYRDFFESRDTGNGPMWNLSEKGRAKANTLELLPPDKEVRAMLNAPEGAIARNGHKFFTLTEKDYVIRPSHKDADRKVLAAKRYIAQHGPSNIHVMAKSIKVKPASLRWAMVKGNSKEDFSSTGKGKYTMWTLNR